MVVGAESEPRGAWIWRHEQYLDVGVVTHVSDQLFEVTFDDHTKVGHEVSPF